MNFKYKGYSVYRWKRIPGVCKFNIEIASQIYSQFLLKKARANLDIHEEETRES